MAIRIVSGVANKMSKLHAYHAYIYLYITVYYGSHNFELNYTLAIVDLFKQQYHRCEIFTQVLLLSS